MLSKEAHMRAHIGPLDLDPIVSAKDLISMENEHLLKSGGGLGKRLGKLSPI
jgi:hypothetical protein